MQPTYQALIDGATYAEPQLREIIARQRPDVIVEDNVVSFPALMTGDAAFVRIVSCNPLEVRGDGIPPVFSGYAADDRSGWAEFLAEFDRTGRIDWVTDLAEIPERYGVTNVYADLGQIFAQTLVAQPRLCAAILGQLIKGLGADHVCWGTDAVWTGSPQWQIEGLRRLEIPEAMQRAHGFAPLGPADGPVKNGIFGGNNARLYNIDPVRARAALDGDLFSARRRDYLAAGAQPSNRRYGYVARP